MGQDHDDEKARRATDRAAAREVFDPIAADFLPRPGVDIGRIFGSEGLRIRGKIFAFVSHDGQLIAKLPEERIEEYERSTSAARMIMRHSALREWMTVPLATPDLWADVIDEAFAFVDSITP